MEDTGRWSARLLADGSFVHVSFHNHNDDEINAISPTHALTTFQENNTDRRIGDVDQQTTTRVRSYLTVIDSLLRVAAPRPCRREGLLTQPPNEYWSWSYPALG